jgi:hypothetical protein
MVERLEQVDSGLIGYIYRRAGRGPRFVGRLRERIAARTARRTGPQAVPSAELLAFRRPKNRRTSARS